MVSSAWWDNFWGITRPWQGPNDSLDYLKVGFKCKRDYCGFHHNICMQALKSSAQIWLLSNLDSQEDIAYPNDPRVPLIKVDDDLKLLFRGIELPRDMVDIEKDLQKNGMKPATNTARRKAMAQMHGISRSKPKPKKKRELSKRTKLTNAHLPELFQNLNVPDTWNWEPLRPFFLHSDLYASSSSCTGGVGRDYRASYLYKCTKFQNEIMRISERDGRGFRDCGGRYSSLQLNTERNHFDKFCCSQY